MNTNMTGLDVFQKSFYPCALDKSSLSIGRVKFAIRGKGAINVGGHQIDLS